MSTSDDGNNNIREYTVVCGHYTGGPYGQPFDKLVNDLIKNGWRPLGGIVVTSSDNYGGDTLYQAMVR